MRCGTSAAHTSSLASRARHGSPTSSRRRKISSLSHVGRAWGTTWAKAGWYPDDASGFATTVDAGVVRTETGDVVIAVMTTSPVDFPATAGVILPLLELHAELG